MRYARDLGVHENFTKTVAEAFITTYKEEYKNLEEKKESSGYGMSDW